MTENNFWDGLFASNNEIDSTSSTNNDISILYSPLRRASTTCLTLVPPNYVSKCFEKNFLREATPYEHVMRYTLGNT